MMPRHLFLIRHGQSEGNVATEKAKRGDLSSYTDEFVTTPGRTWKLTELGREQAALAGEWLREELERVSPTQERRFYVSPYIRTRQTAGLLQLEEHGRSVEWYVNRTIRERDWGDIDCVPRQQFLEDPIYRLNAQKMKLDPLYWRPPGGESIQDVADNRVRNFLDTLHRECSDQTVVAQSHGEQMKANRIVLERISDEQFLEDEENPLRKIRNCQIVQYTKDAPEGFEAGASKRIQYVRNIVPLVEEGRCEVYPWQQIEFHRPTNEDLLND